MNRADFVTTIAAAVASPLPLPAPIPTGNPSMTVYHVRDATDRKGAISPDDLFHFRGVHIEVVYDPTDISAAAAAVDGARAVPGPDADVDVRWGLRFATATARFVHSVYCDARGTAGYLDGRTVTFANGTTLVAYLEKHYAAS